MKIKKHQLESDLEYKPSVNTRNCCLPGIGNIRVLSTESPDHSGSPPTPLLLLYCTRTMCMYVMFQARLAHSTSNNNNHSFSILTARIPQQRNQWGRNNNGDTLASTTSQTKTTMPKPFQHNYLVQAMCAELTQTQITQHHHVGRAPKL